VGEDNRRNITCAIYSDDSGLVISFLFEYLELHNGELKVITDSLPALGSKKILRNAAYVIYSLPE
jgi:hypothetical protein